MTKSPRLPPVIERKPSDANAREVIAAAERGERLWLEGDEGIVQPMESREDAFVRAARREEEAAWAIVEREAATLREAMDEIDVRVSFDPLPLPENYSPVHEKTVTVRLNEDEEEGA